METVILHRQPGTDQGTPGLLTGPGFSYPTLELPWRNNAAGLSCIPPGQYPCSIVYSPHLRSRVYQVENVAGRANVLIHWGNWAGDKAKGLKTNVEGCILLGLYAGVAGGQRAVLCSRTAVRRFMAAMGNQPFTLDVRDASQHETITLQGGVA